MELDVCSEGFSFDSVSKEYFKEEPNLDFDYHERGVIIENDINYNYDDNDDYVELTLSNMDVITKVNNKFEKKVTERKKEGRFRESKPPTIFLSTTKPETQTTPHHYQEYNQRRLNQDGNTNKTKDLLDRVKVKLFYEELEEEGGEIENVFKMTDEKNKKLMEIIGRILEFCLISLIVITVILCIILLCAIKFC